MRIVLSEFISLDGVVQAPGGPEEDTDGAESTEAFLFGRRTWQTMAAAWPDRDDGSDPFATRINETTKYVVSNTLTDADLTWNNSVLIPGDKAVATISGIKQRDGGDIGVMGSSRLARTLVAEGLVDEYRLMIEPLLLGGGKSVFPTDGERRPLELVSTSTSPTGVLLCVYRPGETPTVADWEG